jgi:branched-chain amino acid transport system substrate-binding protein
MKKGVMVALALCLMLASASAFAAGTIKIGLMAPLTGSWASEGQEMDQVLKLLADEVNTSGGLLGKQVELIVDDDGGDPKTAALAAQRLSTKGIMAVIGTYGSSITEATQNIYDDEEIIQVANGSTAVRLSEKGLNFFFRTCPRDDEQGRVAAETIKKQGYKQVAVLHDNTTYAKGLADETKALLEKMGMTIVFYEALTPKEQDYNVILNKLKAANPDVVFFTGYYPEAGLLLRQKKEMGWNVPFIGGDATNHPDLVKTAGQESAAGFHFVSAPLPKDLPEASSFVESFKSKYGNEPNSIYAVLAGDGFRVVVEAIKQAGSADSGKVADYLHTKLKDFPGLTGKISFNEKGDRVGDVYRVYKVDAEGKFLIQP